MYPFKKLTPVENEELLKFPVFISLLAANNDTQLDKTEEETAIEFAYTKTFSSDPLLSDFYNEAYKVFAKNLAQLDKELPVDKDERSTEINKKLTHVQEIVSKLGSEYVSTMHQSMNSFQEHVKNAHYNGFTSFIFPFPIQGINSIMDGHGNG